MIEVNLFGGFTHLHKDHGIYSMTDNRVPKSWKWVRNKMDHDGVTIFTDDWMCDDKLVKSVKSKYKIGMIIEPPQVNSSVYNQFDRIIENFDLIITYNKDLVEKYPKKVKFYPFGGSWIFEEYLGIYQKSKDICIIYSDKTKTEGHRFRHEISKKFPFIDQYGSGANKPFEFKEEILAPYRYTIVIENSKIDNYFSEKLLDAIALGTIPIYWGTNNIGEYFDKRGIITFNDINELETILPTLNDSMYNSKLEYLKNNLKNVKKYWCQEDWIKENIFDTLDLNEDFEIIDYQSNDLRTMVDGQTQDFWLDKFHRNGSDDQLFDFDDLLDNKSLVFDMGTYDGEYYSKISDKYQCKIHSFEPVAKFTKNCPILPNLTLNTFALGLKEEEFELTLDDNSSSAFTNGTKIKCFKREFKEYVNNIDNPDIDLIKINIEGGEYELLNAIIKSGYQEKIKGYLIQFHYLSHNPIDERAKIIEKLKETHEPIFYYPFVWEYWRKK
jgi:FkbM family methyltransferase